MNSNFYRIFEQAINKKYSQNSPSQSEVNKECINIVNLNSNFLNADINNTSCTNYNSNGKGKEKEDVGYVA